MCLEPDAADHRPGQIVGDGTSEHLWQKWPGLASVPRSPLDKLVPKDARLVVVAPHPDDEVLSCGGLLASHTARGGASLVVTVTDGEASHPGSAMWMPKELAHVRRAESLRGLELLRINQPRMVRLGLPDGGVQNHTVRLISGLHLFLHPTDVVLTTWRYDGHPDHNATGHAVATVCTRDDIRFIEAPVWMWHWAKPGSAHVPWDRMTGFDLSQAALALKRLALAAHKTQLSPRDGPQPAPVLGAGIRKRALRRTEFFFVGG